MMNPALSIDAILTAITCLCSPSNEVPFSLSADNFTVPKSGNGLHLETLDRRIASIEGKIEEMHVLLSQSVFQHSTHFIRTCDDLDIQKDRTKAIMLDISGLKPFKAICKHPHSFGDHWLVIQRRQDGKEDFDRDWETYKNGFGSPEADFFIGLKALHYLTATRPHELLILMSRENNGPLYYALYNTFEVKTEGEGYALNVDGFKGNVSDAFKENSGQKFSTRDRDNDRNPSEHIAKLLQSGGWFGTGTESNLNGPYQADGLMNANGQGIYWKDVVFRGSSLKFVEMLVRGF